MTIERLYCYTETATRKGAIYQGNDPEENGDVFLWGEGTREDLIEAAMRRLNVRYDERAGGAGDAFAHRCARSVLRFFGVDYGDK